QSPSGNIACEYWVGDDDKGGVQCEIREHSWTAPRASICTGDEARKFQGHDANGDEFTLDDTSTLHPGQPMLSCYWGIGPLGAPIVADPNYHRRQYPVLEYGQTQAVGTIGCASTPAGVTCTNSTTGHYIRISRDSYELGG